MKTRNLKQIISFFLINYFLSQNLFCQLDFDLNNNDKTLLSNVFRLSFHYTKSESISQVAIRIGLPERENEFILITPLHGIAKLSKNCYDINCFKEKLRLDNFEFHKTKKLQYIEDISLNSTLNIARFFGVEIIAILPEVDLCIIRMNFNFNDWNVKSNEDVFRYFQKTLLNNQCSRIITKDSLSKEIQSHKWNWGYFGDANNLRMFFSDNYNFQYLPVKSIFKNVNNLNCVNVMFSDTNTGYSIICDEKIIFRGMSGSPLMNNTKSILVSFVSLLGNKNIIWCPTIYQEMILDSISNFIPNNNHLVLLKSIKSEIEKMESELFLSKLDTFQNSMVHIDIENKGDESFYKVFNNRNKQIARIPIKEKKENSIFLKKQIESLCYNYRYYYKIKYYNKKYVGNAYTNCIKNEKIKEKYPHIYWLYKFTDYKLKIDYKDNNKSNPTIPSLSDHNKNLFISFLTDYEFYSKLSKSNLRKESSIFDSQTGLFLTLELDNQISSLIKTYEFYNHLLELESERETHSNNVPIDTNHTTSIDTINRRTKKIENLMINIEKKVSKFRSALENSSNHYPSSYIKVSFNDSSKSIIIDTKIAKNFGDLVANFNSHNYPIGKYKYSGIENYSNLFSDFIINIIKITNDSFNGDFISFIDYSGEADASKFIGKLNLNPDDFSTYMKLDIDSIYFGGQKLSKFIKGNSDKKNLAIAFLRAYYFKLLFENKLQSTNVRFKENTSIVPILNTQEGDQFRGINVRIIIKLNG